MKFAIFDLVRNTPNPVTGETWSDTEKLENIKKMARLAEELNYDAFGVGERHGEPFLSSSPAIILAAIAEQTSKIRLLTTVTVLNFLDPIRVAEDFATIDHLSKGRFELMIGKGNDPRHYDLFNLKQEDQWEALGEKYELLKRLWSEENVTWEGKFRSPIHNVTTYPRPYQKKITIWHGSASSKLSTDLAAKNGDPIFSSNSFHSTEVYKELIDHYKERLEFYGYDPKKAVIGAGSRAVYIANTNEEAIRKFRPYYEHTINPESSYNNDSPFKTMEEHIENGSLFVGSAEKVAERILHFHKAYGHTIQAINFESLPVSEQFEQMERFAKEVIPILKKEIPSFVWEDEKNKVEV